MRFLPQFRIIGNRVGIPDDPVAVYAEHFFSRTAVTVTMGRRKNVRMRKSEDLPFYLCL